MQATSLMIACGNMHTHKEASAFAGVFLIPNIYDRKLRWLFADVSMCLFATSHWCIIINVPFFSYNNCSAELNMFLLINHITKEIKTTSSAKKKRSKQDCEFVT